MIDDQFRFRIVAVELLRGSIALADSYNVRLRKVVRDVGGHTWNDRDETTLIPVNRVEAQHLGARIGEVVNVVISDDLFPKEEA